VCARVCVCVVRAGVFTCVCVCVFAHLGGTGKELQRVFMPMGFASRG
jgi:hypothetical protein